MKFQIIDGQTKWEVTVDAAASLPYSTVTYNQDGPVKHSTQSFEHLMAFHIDPTNSKHWLNINDKK